MRILATTVFIGLLASPALADRTPAVPAPTASAQPAPTWAAKSSTPATNLAPIDVAELPEPCRAIAKQATVANLHAALSARLSLAGCLADQRLAPLELLDCQDSVLAVEQATAPSFELLDGVIAAGDLSMKLLGEHAKGELYTSLAIRMQGTVPSGSSDPASLALRDSRKAILDSFLAPWRDQANTAFEHVVAIAKAHPELAKNPVVKTAVSASQQRLNARLAAS
jgi:hypothetical protein